MANLIFRHISRRPNNAPTYFLSDVDQHTDERPNAPKRLRDGFVEFIALYIVYEKNDKSLPSYYRPVSLTWIRCKLLEHIICYNHTWHIWKTTISQIKGNIITQSTQLKNAIYYSKTGLTPLITTIKPISSYLTSRKRSIPFRTSFLN